jgi:hypothetical protein
MRNPRREGGLSLWGAESTLLWDSRGDRLRRGITVCGLAADTLLSW